jgi:hypothetical protein
MDTITEMRENNSGIMPSALQVLTALQKEGSPLLRTGKLDKNAIYQKIRHLKKKLEKKLHGRRFRGPRALHEIKINERSMKMWPELVVEKEAQDE